MSETPVVKTSEQGWLSRVATAYRARSPILVVDDARVGFDPSSQSLFESALKARLSPREFGAVLVALGLGVFGVGLVVFAFVDPEPTSKLGLLLASGVLCAFTGSFGAMHVLAKVKPPRVQLTARGIEIGWD